MTIRIVVESVEPDFQPVGIELTLNTQADVTAVFTMCKIADRNTLDVSVKGVACLIREALRDHMKK